MTSFFFPVNPGCSLFGFFPSPRGRKHRVSSKLFPGKTYK